MPALIKDNERFVRELLESVHASRKDNVFADVTVVAQNGSTFWLHAALLTNASKFLRQILGQADLPAELRLHDFSENCVEYLCELIHSGSVRELDEEECMELRELCELLQLDIHADDGVVQCSAGTSSCLDDGGKSVEDGDHDNFLSDSNTTGGSDDEDDDNSSRGASSGSGSGSSESDSSSTDDEDKVDDDIVANATASSSNEDEVARSIEGPEYTDIIEVGDKAPMEEEESERAAATLEIVVKLEENLSKSKARKQESEIGLEEDRTDKKRRSRKKRVLMADLEPSELTCQVCAKQFPVMYKLKIHELIHSKSPPFACQFCAYTCNNKYKMRSHEKSHKAGRPIDGSGVPAISPGKKSKKRIATMTKRLSIQCQRCTSIFHTKTALREHLAVSHPDFRQFHCQNCGKSFKGQKGLDHHVNFVCSRQEKRFACTLCPVKLSSPRELQRHLSSQHGPSKQQQQDQQWKCPHCPTVCSSRKSLNVHGKVAHLEGGEMALPYVCMSCGRRFLKQSYLEEHQQRFHVVVKHFACMFCPKRCSTKQDLQRHLRSHQGKPQFQCSLCAKNFVHRATFKQHQLSHRGEKPYRCVPCGKNFGLFGSLRKHQKSHQRKGDQTRIVKAPKGRRGCLSYIDFAATGKTPNASHPQLTLIQPLPPPLQQQQQNLLQPSLEQHHHSRTLIQPLPQHQQFYSPHHQVQQQQLSPSIRNRPQAYIPSAHYIQGSHISITPLSQMQVLGDYGEMSTYNLNADGGNYAGYSGAQGTSSSHVHQSSNNGMMYQPHITYHTLSSSYQSHHHLTQSNDQQVYHQQPAAPSGAGIGQGDSLQQQQQQQHHTETSIAVSSIPRAAAEEMTETESIAMDIMGLFNEPALHGTETPIEKIN